MCSSSLRKSLVALLLAFATLSVTRGAAFADGETSQPTTTFAFSVTDGGPPRVLFLGRERRTEVVLRNDGFAPWQGERTFYLAPRWLAVTSGRVLEEGFRTPIRDSVEPGDTVRMVVRTKTPSSWGVYRLHWDLLSEKAGRFDQFDSTPEAPRWALVLPPVEFFLAVLLPCLVLAVIVGKRYRTLNGSSSSTHRAGQRSDQEAGLFGISALAWCFTSLLGKPYLLYAELPPKFEPAPNIAIFSLVALLILPISGFSSRLRWPFAWCLAALGALAVWAQLLYFRFFNDLASSAAFLASRQTADLGGSIAALASPRDLWLLIDLLVALVFILFASHEGPPKPVRSRKLVAAALAVLALPAAWSGARAITTGQLQGRQNLQNLRAVSQHGLYGFQIFDGLDRLVGRWRRAEASEAEFERALSWFAETAPERARTGAAPGLGFNLVAIQVESMQGFVLDLDINGTPVTPHLRALRESALEFTTVLDQTHRGRSSAGDFVTMTSLLPIGESIAYEYPRNKYFAMGHALAERGYRTLSAIPYKRHFWNRQVTHPAYGFESNLFRESFERVGPRVGWGINDRDFLNQMVPLLQGTTQPFFAWLTTLSLHYPYESFPAELKTLDLGELEGSALGNYLHGMNFFDRALADFLQKLEATGRLDRTVVAIWGDHSSGLNRDPKYLDFFGLETPAEKFLFRRVPFLVWLPGENSPRGRYAAPAGQVDIAPTLLALMGADASSGAFQGRNLLADNGSVRVVHPQGRWIDQDLIHLSQFAQSRDSCFRASNLARVHPSNCQAGVKQAEEQIEVVDLVLRFDLQARISERLRSMAGNGAGRPDPTPESSEKDEANGLVDVAESP